ncbi:DUF6479 family protein [Actinacidiphila glaucinigra]|uniref:DUF6479 family protein n=1 Tax=Actinacidiphila glaucinigra TaxID=235986 RepID=UPI0033B7DD10
MRMDWMQLAVRHDYLVGTVPLFVGIVLVIILVSAVAIGRRVRRRQPPPPRTPQPGAGSWHTNGDHGPDTDRG